jgi:hypothetical protein
MSNSFLEEPPLWSTGQSSWLQIQRSLVRFPALPNFLEVVVLSRPYVLTIFLLSASIHICEIFHICSFCFSLCVCVRVRFGRGGRWRYFIAVCKICLCA